MIANEVNYILPIITTIVTILTCAGCGKRLRNLSRRYRFGASCGEGQGQVIPGECYLLPTTLRDRRNALHWGKAKSFIADHSETATLLMAAPLHLGTLETIRAAC